MPQLANHLDQGDDVFDRRLLMDAVPEVENVTGPARRPGPARRRRGGGFRRLGQQHGRIEIALHGPIVADQLPGGIEPHRQSTPITLPPASATSGNRAGLPAAK